MKKICLMAADAATSSHFLTGSQADKALVDQINDECDSMVCCLISQTANYVGNLDNQRHNIHLQYHQ